MGICSAASQPRCSQSIVHAFRVNVEDCCARWSYSPLLSWRLPRAPQCARPSSKHQRRARWPMRLPGQWPAHRWRRSVTAMRRLLHKLPAQVRRSWPRKDGRPRRDGRRSRETDVSRFNRIKQAPAKPESKAALKSLTKLNLETRRLACRRNSARSIAKPAPCGTCNRSQRFSVASSKFEGGPVRLVCCERSAYRAASL